MSRVTCTSKRWMSSTDFRTNNLVDSNWTVTVIIKVRLPPKLLMTPHLSLPAYRRGRRPPWRIDNFSARNASESKNSQPVEKQIFTYPPAFGAPIDGDFMTFFCAA